MGDTFGQCGIGGSERHLLDAQLFAPRFVAFEVMQDKPSKHSACRDQFPI